MWKLRRGFCLVTLLLLCSLAAFVAAKGSTTGSRKWLTLSGEPPLVIARGGFSGVFADSSDYAYRLALLYGPDNLHVWCNVQLTKDGSGICFPNIKLDNSSNISAVYPNSSNSYQVNGNTLQGWFSVDFTFHELAFVNLQQGIYSRPSNFDDTPMRILTVNDVINLSPPGLWLNFQNVAFFRQHNLNMINIVTSVSRNSTIDYISSPDAGFLKSVSRLRLRRTKLVFQFLLPEEKEPSTGLSYESLKSNLTFIKAFASGILVPKTYIWPVDERSYLLSSTLLVRDAHNSGLAVFSSNFVNDFPLPYNYSFDPVTEYLNFIDNGQFSVDGLLSDFPLTSTASVDCFSHMGKNDTVQENFLIISSEGASGDYPGCTDVAYENAVLDGVDILDCPVQVTSDGIPFCLGSINLKDKTDATQSPLSDRATANPDLGIKDGIFAYNLTWREIQTVSPLISNPFFRYSMYRNPSASNVGKFMRLSEFLSFANNASSLPGVVIGIENAAYLAEKQGIGVTDIVLDALSKAAYNQTAKRVMIKSTDSAVLKKFKSTSKYELVYVIEEDVRDILNETILEICKFANAVMITRNSVFPTQGGFITGENNVVSNLRAFNLSVYVGSFRNEFVSQPWDFFCDPYVEINSNVFYKEINGVITDYPATSSRFRRNRCLRYKTPPNYMSPVQRLLPRGLIPFITSDLMPPAEAPSPILRESDVVESPLPSVQARTPQTLGTGNGSTASAQSPSNNGVPRLVSSCIFFGVISIICSAVLF